MKSGLCCLPLKVLSFFSWQVVKLLPNLLGQVRFNFRCCSGEIILIFSESSMVLIPIAWHFWGLNWIPEVFREVSPLWLSQNSSISKQCTALHCLCRLQGPSPLSNPLLFSILLHKVSPSQQLWILISAFSTHKTATQWVSQALLGLYLCTTV